MADRGKYVDIIFRNGLREFEVLPPPGVWKNIQPSLIRREKYLTIFRFVAVAAIFVSLSGFAFWLSNELSKDLNGPAISFNQDNLPGGIYQKKNQAVAALKIEPVIENKIIETPVSVNKDAPPSEIQPNTSNPELVPQTSGETSFRKITLLSERSREDDLNVFSGTVENFNPAPDISVVSNEGNRVNRWAISAMATPNYFSGTGIGPNLTFPISVNPEKPAVSYSGGLAVSFTVNKRLSIQSGVYYSSLGQEVENVDSYGGFEKYFTSKGEGTFGIQTSSGMIVSNNNDIFLRDNISTRVSAKYGFSSLDPVKANLKYLSNSVIQNFNYLEVPVLVKYRAVDRKLDVIFVGGLSYNMLVGNSAFSYVEGEKFLIGKTDEISPANVSSSIGLGFEYYLWEKVTLNLEPTFRYYITPLGGMTGAAAHPYSFGILSGISYKF